jgi:hypothetical protein
MFDSLTVVPKVKTHPEDMVTKWNRNTGAKHDFPQRKRVKGKDPKKGVRLSYAQRNTELVLTGNLNKFLTGQNVIGTMNLLRLGYLFVKAVCKKAGVELTDEELEAVKEGDYEVSEVHIAAYLRLPSPKWKARVIKALKVAFAARRFATSARGHHYFAVGIPRYIELAIYDKTRETNGYQKLPAELAKDDKLRRVLDTSLRVEVRLFSRELARLQLTRASDWDDVSVRDLFFAELKRFGIRGPVSEGVDSDANASRLTRLERELWEKQVDILEGLPRATRSSRIRAHRRLGYDITLPYAGPERTQVDLAHLFSRENFRFGHPKWLRSWKPLARLLPSSERAT